MAEAFCNQLAPQFETKGAGTHVPPEFEGKPITLRTKTVVRAMGEVGIDMTQKQMHQLTPEMVAWADKVIALHTREELPDYLLAADQKLEVWNVPDAADTDLEFHENIMSVIETKVKDLLKRLVQ